VLVSVLARVAWLARCGPGGGALGGVLLGRYGLSGVFWGSAAIALAWAAIVALGPAVSPFPGERG